MSQKIENIKQKIPNLLLNVYLKKKPIEIEIGARARFTHAHVIWIGPDLGLGLRYIGL